MTVDGLDGAEAVVSGGGSGIGAAVVRLLERSGANVHVADLSGDPPVDVTDRGTLDALASRIQADHGGLDVLVNAAGILTQNLPVDELPADDFRRNYEVNVIGTGTYLGDRGRSSVPPSAFRRHKSHSDSSS